MEPRQESMWGQMLSLHIPSVWKCEDCKHQGLEITFKTEAGHLCPRCNSEDVFPTRWFKCTICGEEGEQEEFFTDRDSEGIDVPRDEHPIYGWHLSATCPNINCPSHDIVDDFDCHTEVVEIPVPGFAA